MHVIGTAGHVDHGKSALVERLTGIDPDRWAEEKRRGLTIDLGFAWLSLPSGKEVGIVDVPGHERFIKNMLAGAGGISICLFVVAANEGWMPQSAEHLTALEVLGISTVVVAVTKSDTVDEAILELALEDVREHLEPTSLRGTPIVACSAVTGAGIDDLIRALDDAVDSAPPLPDLHRARLWIDRVFTISGAGTVVTGTLAGGSLRTGEAVEVLGPARRRRDHRARIRRIQSHKKQVDMIGPGNRAALNLVGLERTDAARGDAVVHIGSWLTTSLIDASVLVAPETISGRRHELTEKGSHLLYAGSAETPVRIKLLDAERVGPGERGFAQLTLRDQLPLGRGDRFVLRDAGRVATFGGGEVLDPLPGPALRKDPQRLELLRRLQGAEADGALSALVESLGAVPVAEAMMRTGAVAATNGIISLGPLFVSTSHFDSLVEKLRSTLADYHGTRPLERGMPHELLRAELNIEPAALDALLERTDDIVEDQTIVRLASHRVVLSDEQRRERDRIIKLIDEGAFSPPLANELDGDALVLRSLVESSELIRIGDFYLTSDRARQARTLVRAHIERAGPITVAGIRDLLGTTRKYAVPLCEWLDQTGATRRRGDERVLGPNP